MDRFCVVILGASEWPRSNGRLSPAIQFKNSAEAFLTYCKESAELAVTEESVLNLFDDPDPVSDIDEKILKFLTIQSSIGVSDLIVYYVGHGAFTETERRYCLAVRSTRADNKELSAYKVTSLARTIYRSSPRLRRYIIIDACFAGSAAADFQSSDIFMSAPIEAIEAQLFDSMTPSGTALLCASGPREPAISKTDDRFTMFSGALLSVLQNGFDVNLERLSFSTLRAAIDSVVRDRYRNEAVRSQLHVTDQDFGDISKRGVFPNRRKGMRAPIESQISIPALSLATSVSELDKGSASGNSPFIAPLFAPILHAKLDKKMKLLASTTIGLIGLTSALGLALWPQKITSPSVDARPLEIFEDKIEAEPSINGLLWNRNQERWAPLGNYFVVPGAKVSSGVRPPSDSGISDGEVSSDSVFQTTNPFGGGLWSNQQQGSAWTRIEFSEARRVSRIYVFSAGTDVSSSGSLIDVQVRVPGSLGYFSVFRLGDAVINRGFSGGTYGNQVGPILVEFPAQEVAAVQILMTGHGWFGLEDVRVMP